MKFFIFIITFLSMFYCYSQDSNRWAGDKQREGFAVKVMGFEKCTQCHRHAEDAWKRSHHFKSLETLNLDKDGKSKAIMGAMGLKGSPASEASCAKCHFTDKQTKSKNQFTGKNFGPTYGVSCESCHSAATDWHELHNKDSQAKIKDKYNLLKHDDEAVLEEKRAKFLKSVHIKSIDMKIPGDFLKWRNETTAKVGMIRPDMTYNLISNCYECHTIGHRELINKTAELDVPHAAGSEFEIVSWLSGEVKHNFKNSDPDNPKNKPFTKEEKRYLFVAGKILFAEHALRALRDAEFPKSEDDEPTRFYDEMKARAEIGLSEITELNDATEGGVPEIKTLAEKLTDIIEKIGDDKLKKTDITSKTFDGKTLIEFLANMNKKFLAGSSKNAALSKLDVDYLNGIEPVGSVYKQ